MRILSNVVRDTRGATAIEYGLIIGFVVIVIIGGIDMVAGKTIRMWDHVAVKVTQS